MSYPSSFPQKNSDIVLSLKTTSENPNSSTTFFVPAAIFFATLPLLHLLSIFTYSPNTILPSSTRNILTSFHQLPAKTISEHILLPLPPNTQRNPKHKPQLTNNITTIPADKSSSL